MRTLIRSLCTLLLLASPAVSSASQTVVLSGSVGAADSTCNAAVTPWAFPLADDTSLLVVLAVPTGLKIVGWSCDANLCSRRFGAADLDENGVRMETLKIVGVNPAHTIGATIVIAEPDALPVQLPFTIPVSPYPVYAPNVCCACPCDFAESCS